MLATQDTNVVPLASPEAIRVSVFTDERKPDAPKKIPPPPAAASRSRWRNVAFALLGFVVLAQAGYIGFWMLTGGVVAATPDTGSATVTSEPSGLPVTIDGTARGATPLTVSLASGSHRVEIGAGAQLRGQQMNVIRGGHASIHLELAAVPAAGAMTGTGELQIATEPAGARVWIDSEARGITPLTVSNLKVGAHAVTVRSGSGEAVNRTVIVQEATVASLVISLNGSAAFASGWLAITSGVPLQILEKGVLVGTTDTTRLLLPAGNHELELVNTLLDYRVPRTVQITAGQTTTVGLKLPMSTISVNALPWAEVWIDGQRVGETPIGNFSIAIGSHEVLFRHPELGEQRRKVTVGALAPVRVGVDLRKP